MPWNKKFFAAAQNLISKIDAIGDANEREKAEAERLNALNVLLRADPSDQEAFKQAISAHLSFWQRFDDLAGLNQTEIDKADFFEVAQLPTEETLKQIHQEAAKQRVLLGLKGADEDILVAILANNSTQCRDYLAQKSSFGPLARTPGWQEDMSPPQPGNSKVINVLPDEAIKDIQAEAARLLLIKKIEQAKDVQLLENLQSALLEDEFVDAAKALGFPDGRESLEAVKNYYTNYNPAHELKPLFEKHISKLKKETARAKYEEMVAGETHGDMLGHKIDLEGDDNAFKDVLDNMPELKDQFKDEGDIQWAKGIMGQRFLKAYLPENCSPTQLLTIINADGVDKAVAAVKVLLPDGDQSYIKHAITADSLASIKTSMVQGVLAQFADAKKISPIINAKDIDQFKAALKGIGVTEVDWITDEAQMVEIQKTARERQFEIEIANTSKLGARAHSQLITAFKALEPEKQAQILANDNNEIRHLLNAKDTVSLRHYLGDLKPTSLLTDVINQNKNTALFKELHNASVAKILMDMHPPITLDAGKVAAINTAIDAHTDFSAPAYKGLVDVIKTQCGVVSGKAIYNAFGLNDDGSALSQNPPPIQKQHEHNKDTLNFLNTSRAPGEHQKKFIGVLLSINKSTPLTHADRKKIAGAFSDSSSLSDFIAKVGKIKPTDKEFIAGITNEFTRSMYNEIKAGMRKRNISNSKVNIANDALDSLESEFENLQKGQKGLNKKEELEIFLKIKPIHLFNPTFQTHARTEAAAEKAKYEATAEECASILDQLRRNRWSLQSYLDSLPTGTPPHGDPAVAKRIADLRSSIEAERDEVDNRIDFYKQVEEKLIGKDGILAACDEAIKGAKSYYAIGQSVRVTRYNIDDPGNRTDISNQSGISSPTASQTGGSATVRHFLIADKLKPNEAADYEISYTTQKKVGGVTSNVETKGCFTETHPNTEAGIVTSKDGKVSKDYPSRFEVKQFPQKGAGQTEADVTSARVSFAMDMAKSILGSMDGPPSEHNKIYLVGTNQEELAYLWTALVILGEKDPNMKFDRSLIDTSASSFNPKSQRDTTLFVEHYASNSLYKTAFQTHADVVDTRLQHMQAISQDKLGHKKEATAQAGDAMKAMKSSYTGMKSDRAETVKNEGVAPKIEEAEQNRSGPSVGISSRS